MEKILTYWAFISYSHGDTDWADWLHKRLEVYKIPTSLRSAEAGIGKRLYPIFRDREELPGSADLGAKLDEALTNSKSLLVICSPRSAQSVWVNQEIISYQQVSPGKPIIAVLVGGQDTRPDGNDYCLPMAMAELLAKNSAERIDTRTTGKSVSLVLQLLALLTGQPLTDFIAQDAKHRRNRNIWRMIVLAGIAAASILAWQQIQLSRTQAQIAQASAYTVEAQQAWSKNQAGKALQAISRAAAIADANEAIEVEGQTQALLNQIMTTPLLELEIGRLGREITQLNPSRDPNLWLLEDSEAGLHVFDLKIGKVLWSLPTQGLQAYAVNSNQQLIVRVDGKMQNFDLLTGVQHCQLDLETQTALSELGRLDWLQQDWFAELTGEQTDQGHFAIQQVQFVDSRTCTLTKKRDLGWSTGFGLMAVLDDENFVIAFDTFNSSGEGKSQAINVIQRWPKDALKETKTLFAIPGVIRQYIPGSHNMFQYDGPIYKSQTDAPISYLAFHNEQKERYEIVRMDWSSQEVTHRQVIDNIPKHIFWANADRDAVIVNQVTSGQNDGGEFIVLGGSDLTPHGPYPVAGALELFSISPDYSQMLSNGTLNIRWTNLATNERSERGSQTISSSQSERRTNWLNKDTGILAHADGRITKLVVNQRLQLTQLDDKNCCAGTLDAKAGLLRGHDGSIYQLRDTNLTKLVAATSKDAEYQRLSPRHILQRIPIPEAYREYSYQIWDLHKAEMVHEFQANEKKLHVGSRWLTLQTEDSIVLTDFINGKRQQMKAPKGLIKAQLSDDGQTLLMTTYLSSIFEGDDLTHFKQVKVTTGDVISDVAYEIGDVSLSADIWLDLTKHKAVALPPNQGGNQLQLLDLVRQEQHTLGNLGSGFSGLADKTVTMTDDHVLISTMGILTGTFSTVVVHSLFNIDSGERINAKDGQRLLVTPELIAVQTLVQIDDASRRISLMHVEDQSLYQVDCPYDFEVDTFVIDAQSIGLQTRQNVCIVDIATGTVSKRVSSPKRKEGFSFGDISAYALDEQNQLIVLTYSGLRISSAAPKSWAQQLEHARKLLTNVEVEAQGKD